MILGISNTGAPVDISYKQPVQSVKPVPPVFRSLEHPAAIYEPGGDVPPMQYAYGPATRVPET